MEIWITVRLDNIASCRTLEKAGANFEGTLAVASANDVYAWGDLHMRRYRLSMLPAPASPHKATRNGSRPA